MKKGMVILIVLLAAGLCFASGSGESSAKSGPIEIKLAHENSVDQPIHRYSEMFAEKVKEYSEGRINVTVYPAGQLGNMTDLTTNVSLGIMDMCINIHVSLPPYSP